jgi:hypothetical protein
MAVLGEPPSLDGTRRRASTPPTIRLQPGATIVHRATRFGGVVADFRDGGVEIEGVSGDRRLFRLIEGGFFVDGKVVSVAPAPLEATTKTQRTASGSIAVGPRSARVARASRIWVEGVHDAELVEKVWGDDLRVEGVAIERLDGIDDLEERLAEFFRSHAPGSVVGVLVDHLVPGSKEQRIANGVAQRFGDAVLVMGTPYVDVWQAVRPERLGMSRWPVIPRGQDWKTGIGIALGVSDSAMLWRQILAAVRSYADLEASLVGSVESLIDFVCESGDE